MDRITAAVAQVIALQEALGHRLQIADAYLDGGAEEKPAGLILLHFTVVLKPVHDYERPPCGDYHIINPGPVS